MVRVHKAKIMIISDLCAVHPVVGEGEAAVVGDDDVVQQLQADGRDALAQLLRPADVRRAGRRIAAGVVVDEDQRAGVLVQGSPDDLPDVPLFHRLPHRPAEDPGHRVVVGAVKLTQDHPLHRLPVRTSRTSPAGLPGTVLPVPHP